MKFEVIFTFSWAKDWWMHITKYLSHDIHKHWFLLVTIARRIPIGFRVYTFSNQNVLFLEHSPLRFCMYTLTIILFSSCNHTVMELLSYLAWMFRGVFRVVSIISCLHFHLLGFLMWVHNISSRIISFWKITPSMGVCFCANTLTDSSIPVCIKS